MSVNLLAINVGNTRSQLAAFVDGKLGDVHYAVHGDPRKVFMEELEKVAGAFEGMGDVPVYLASVNDAAGERAARDVKTLLAWEVSRIEEDVTVPIGRQLDPETLVGDDRLLNAAAAYDRAKQALVVVDAGTAVTVDFVDGQGTFQGGAILPGAVMMLRTMHEQTAQLPEVGFAAPEDAIGHNTTQAMLSGVFHGIRGAVRELCEKYAEEYGAYPKIIATGGDAHALFDGYELVEAIVPELTLLGMAVTRRYELQNMEE